MSDSIVLNVSGNTSDTVILKVSGQGPRGKSGDIHFATFSIDPETGELIMSYLDAYTGPHFSVSDDGFLYVNL